MTKQEFSLKLAKLRMAKDISAREMSLRIGQNITYINAIENTKSMPLMDNFFEICSFLGISESDFFDNGTQYPEEYLEVVNDLKKLDDESFKIVKALIKKLIK